jgi:hypothetical protein
MRRNDQWRWLSALGAALAVAVCALAVGSLGSPGSVSAVGNTAHTKSTAHARRAAQPFEPSTLAAELEAMYSGRSTVSDSLNELTSSPGMPSCKAPPLPAATHPPGHSYGVPFLAAITGGEILTGYDEWTANNNVYKVGSKTYHLYPWQSKISNITGWVTGLLQLPSLNAEVPPQDVVFCDQGGRNCVGANPPPAGECIDISAQYAPSPASKTPPPPITNYPPAGRRCWGAPGCLPIVLTLTPTGTTTLTVTGVEPNGALDLHVTTAAVTTATEIPPPGTTQYPCSNDKTTIALSTTAPTGLPATAPGPPTPPNSDDRSLQTPPQPLTGPLSLASSTLAGNDFAIPAFISSKSSSGDCFNAGAVPYLLDTYAGGWGPTFNDQSEGRYFLDGGKASIVAAPGWAQFTATTTVVTLGLPTGPPPNFHF